MCPKYIKFYDFYNVTSIVNLCNSKTCKETATINRIFITRKLVIKIQNYDLSLTMVTFYLLYPSILRLT